ncbi:Zinc-binding alcohol dehydrogenase domain-containing cipB [Madurella fahalii]|uniref:Zinc-binding alcohol dehydrogenase domain-containing cipB n=1 Tax=Madurella fahalii TaxID=1157608 RepID=A0ABQ0FYM4_9PEZI
MSPNYAALQVGHKVKPLRVELVDDRYPDEDEIVVRNAAVAINQLDWKIQDYAWEMFNYPLILGVDVAGEVVEVGCDVDERRFKVGDRVVGHALSFATKDQRHGGFQNYTVLQSNMATPIPQSLSFEKAVVLPLGVSTASAALFNRDCLALPRPSLNPRPTSTTLLVWGGSSSVGCNAIQLAVAAGCEVIVTASPRNFDKMRELGAALAIDYNSKTVVEELEKAFQGRRLAGAFDTIGKQETLGQTAQAVLKIDRTKMVVSTIDDIEEGTVPEGVIAKPVLAVSIRGGEEEEDAGQENVGKMVYEDFLPGALKAGKYKAEPQPKIVGRGLGSIQAALTEASGGVSAAKLVVTLEQDISS